MISHPECRARGRVAGIQDDQAALLALSTQQTSRPESAASSVRTDVSYVTSTCHGASSGREGRAETPVIHVHPASTSFVKQEFSPEDVGDDMNISNGNTPSDCFLGQGNKHACQKANDKSQMLRHLRGFVVSMSARRVLHGSLFKVGEYRAIMALFFMSLLQLCSAESKWLPEETGSYLEGFGVFFCELLFGALAYILTGKSDSNVVKVLAILLGTMLGKWIPYGLEKEYEFLQKLNHELFYDFISQIFFWALKKTLLVFFIFYVALFKWFKDHPDVPEWSWKGFYFMDNPYHSEYEGMLQFLPKLNLSAPKKDYRSMV